MDAYEVLDNNFEAKDNSFLFHLLYKRVFFKEGLRQLCECIYTLAEQNIKIATTATKINKIYGQILKCFLYHFDPNDPYVISNLPENYNRMINQLEKSIDFYFTTRITN